MRPSIERLDAACGRRGSLARNWRTEWRTARQLPANSAFQAVSKTVIRR